MKMHMHGDLTVSNRIGVAVATVLLGVMAAGTAYADAPATPVCNPLASVANNLYLVDPTGKVLTQYTSDGNPKIEPAISPDGSKVAYLASTDALGVSIFDVSDQYGRQGSFSVSLPSEHPSDQDGTFGLGANGEITELSWSSNGVLRVAKFAGKDVARFEFYRIPDDLTGSAHFAASPVLEQNCVAANDGDIAACIERQGNITLDDGSVNGPGLFSVTGFEGATPLQSFTLGVGDTVAAQTGSPFAVTVKSVGNGQVTLRLTSDTGIWSEMQIQSGSYMPEVDHHTRAVFGYFATIVNAATGQVRIDVTQSNSSQYVFDLALAWQPDGHGLMFVRRALNGAVMDLIQPSSHAEGQHSVDHRQVTAHSDGRDGRDGGGGNSGWTLAASAPVTLPVTVKSMRFVSPSLVLLQMSDGSFGELPVQISHGQPDNQGSVTLAVGSLTVLPQTTSVTINGVANQAKILDWSCQVPDSGSDN